ncbi:MAG: HAD family hydrolase [Ilumatobacter sp.]|uniref:HAD family hydrolase n=1 Tax=Ilumatobacter sp. TaxID=1967498 RepID=UPI0039189047
MSHQVRAVVFDFDGLLMDTESTNIASWEAEWSEWGLKLDRRTFFVPHGGDVTEHRYELLAAAVGDSFDRVLSHERRTASRDALNVALQLSAGIDAWLAEAAEQGLATAVASSSPISWVERHLRGVGASDRFELIVGGDQVPAHKPAPDIYQLAVASLGVDPTEAVAVEDTAHGVDAAQSAGLACVAIPNPHVDPERVSHADLVLSGADECTLTEAIRRSTERQ